MVVGGRELIDTLWNVNDTLSHWRQIPENGINRNIVECKFSCFFYGQVDVSELIETLWNVNDIRKCGRLMCGSELIETLWNVNSLK